MTLTALNPATEEPIAELEQPGVDEADEAVARARAAYPAGRTSGFGRELGMHALDGYSEVKSVFISTEG